MDAVKAFNAELSSLYDVKPPISKAKMNSLTRGAIKAIKFYKHVVQSVEKFIQKCKPEYKVPGLYVIDSIVRQSRHQFGVEKDVFAPRFAKNMQITFLNLLKCPPEDKSKVIRVLNLWQKNAVFQPEVIQPLFDLADPNHPIHKEQPANTNGSLNTTNVGNLSSVNPVTKTPPTSGSKGTPKDQKLFSSSSSSKSIDPVWLAQTKMETANIANANKMTGQSGTNQVDVSLLAQLHHLQQLLLKKQEAAAAANEAQSVKFDKKLLDFDYDEEEDDDLIIGSSPVASQSNIGQHNSSGTGGGSLEGLGNLLTNPEVLKQLQTLQQTMQSGNAATTQHEMEEKMRKLQQMKQQEDEFDKHLAQTVPSLPFASECELKPSDILKPSQQTGIYNQTVSGVNINSGVMQQDMSQPPPGYPPALPYASQPPQSLQNSLQNVKSPLIDERQDSMDFQSSAPPRRDSSSVEIVNCDNIRSQSGSPDRYRRRSRSRSPRHRDRERNRERDKERDRKSRSRSRSRRRRSRSRERDRERKRDDSRDKMSEEEREKQRERRKRGLPPIVRDKLSVCSTTLWVGHLSKLVHQEELSDTFGEFGDIVSIDLISPRGCAFICMNRRQDAYRALTKLKSHKMQGKAITLAWAPGKGVKGKEWKDYWEVELGVSYIPWNKLNNVTDQDLELLEEGGMIDEDTLPPRLKGKLKHAVSSTDTLQHQLHLQQQALAAASVGGTPIPTLTDGIVNVMGSSDNGQQQQQQQQIVDTSQPPPIRPPTTASLLAAPNAQLQMMPPGFGLTGVTRMIGPMGLQMAHGLMPNVPIGVPPPNMQGLIGPGMMQTMLTPPVNSPFGTGVGVGLLAQIPLPAPAAPSDKPSATGMPHNVPPMGVPPPTSEANLANLPMLRQPFGIGPPPGMQMQQLSQQQQQQQQQQQHSDDMDVEMDMEEDMIQQNNTINMSSSSSSSIKEKPQNLSDQLLAAMGKSHLSMGLDDDIINRGGGGDMRLGDRNRDRDNRDRDRRDRGGGGERDNRNDNRDDSVDSRRDRGRGRDRGRRRDRERNNDDRRGGDRGGGGEREIRDIRNQDGPAGIITTGQNNNNQQQDSDSKKESKPSLADRLRQLADGTLPIDDRIEQQQRGGGICGRNDRMMMERGGGGGGGGGGGDRQSYEDIVVVGSGTGVIRRQSDNIPPSLMDLPKFPLGGSHQDRQEFSLRCQQEYLAQDPRDYSQQRGGDRGNFCGVRGSMRGGSGVGPIDDFSDPRMHVVGRFNDDFDGRINGPPRPEDFNPRIGGPLRDEFDRPDIRGGRHPTIDDYERERYEYEIRQREAGFDPRINEPYDPRGHPDNQDFDPRRRDFFNTGHMEPPPGFCPPPSMMGPRGPRGGPLGPEGFGPRGPGIGPRGHGPPPMFHPRGMGPRGMRPGMRPPFGPRGGPQFDNRGGGGGDVQDPSFYRPQFDDLRIQPHQRSGFGVVGGIVGVGVVGGGISDNSVNNPGIVGGIWRGQQEGWSSSSSLDPLIENGLSIDNKNIIDQSTIGSSRDQNENKNHHRNNNNQQQQQQQQRVEEENVGGGGGSKSIIERENRNRNRKSRWGNVSPPPADHTFNEERSIFVSEGEDEGEEEEEEDYDDDENEDDNDDGLVGDDDDDDNRRLKKQKHQQQRRRRRKRRNRNISEFLSNDNDNDDDKNISKKIKTNSSIIVNNKDDNDDDDDDDNIVEEFNNDNDEDKIKDEKRSSEIICEPRINNDDDDNDDRKIIDKRRKNDFEKEEEEKLNENRNDEEIIDDDVDKKGGENINDNCNNKINDDTMVADHFDIEPRLENNDDEMVEEEMRIEGKRKRRREGEEESLFNNDDDKRIGIVINNDSEDNKDKILDDDDDDSYVNNININKDSNNDFSEPIVYDDNDNNDDDNNTREDNFIQNLNTSNFSNNDDDDANFEERRGTEGEGEGEGEGEFSGGKEGSQNLEEKEEKKEEEEEKEQ